MLKLHGIWGCDSLMLGSIHMSPLYSCLPWMQFHLTQSPPLNTIQTQNSEHLEKHKMLVQALLWKHMILVGTLNSYWWEKYIVHLETYIFDKHYWSSYTKHYFLLSQNLPGSQINFHEQGRHKLGILQDLLSLYIPSITINQHDYFAYQPKYQTKCHLFSRFIPKKL